MINNDRTQIVGSALVPRRTKRDGYQTEQRCPGATSWQGAMVGRLMDGPGVVGKSGVRSVADRPPSHFFADATPGQIPDVITLRGISHSV